MNLRVALRLKPGEIVAIAGGGGKTTLLYAIGRETVAAGGRAILTGTTRFTPAAAATMPPLVLEQTMAALLPALRKAIAEHPLVVAGAGWGNQGRILPVEPEALAAMAAFPDVAVVVAEADGSAGRPFKAPAEHEPVVAPSTTLLVVVAGMDVLGKPLATDAVHRPELVAALLGVALGDSVTEETVARVLLHARGGRKGLPAGARWIPVLNKADTPERVNAARRIARLLVSGGAPRAVIASAAHDPPVVEVVVQR